MASCKLGHVYIVETVLTKPPKPKFALCVCVAEGFFIWINTKPRQAGRDQLPLAAGCHELVRHDSFLDLSHVVKHPTWELEEAREFPCIGAAMAQAIIDQIEKGLDLMPQRHAEIVRANLRSLLEE